MMTVMTVMATTRHAIIGHTSSSNKRGPPATTMPSRTTRRLPVTSSYALFSLVVVLFYVIMAMTSLQYHFLESDQMKLPHTPSTLSSSSSTTTLVSSSTSTTTTTASSSSMEFTKAADKRVGRCAINLYGLPRSFRHYVLPSLRTNVLHVNAKYRCDYFVHYYNTTTESADSRSGMGGNIVADDVLDLRAAVLDADSQFFQQNQQHQNQPQRQQQQHQIYDNASSESSPAEELRRWNSRTSPPVVKFVSDTVQDFERDRRGEIRDVLHHPQPNPYFIQEESFTNHTLLNILKMWHSQERVWDLMEEEASQQRSSSYDEGGSDSSTVHNVKYYTRVAMMRLDVIYMTSIDIYRVPNDPIPTMDFNEEYQQGLRRPSKEVKRRIQDESRYYFYDYDNQHAVIPGFKSFPVNDRFFVGPYEATKIWASGRFGRAHHHVMHVLPSLDLKHQLAAARTNYSTTTTTTDTTMTRLGLHDESFVAYTLLPAIREQMMMIHHHASDTGRANNNGSTNTTTTSSSSSSGNIHVDRNLYFMRVRADGSIWIKDKPGFGRVPKGKIEAILQRPCQEPFEVEQDYSPGRWQIRCPTLPPAE